MEKDRLWQAVLSEVELTVSSANFKTWLQKTCLIQNAGERITVGVPNVFTIDRLENHFKDSIRTALDHLQPGITTIEYTIEKAKKLEPAGALTGGSSSGPKASAKTRIEQQQMNLSSAKLASHNLNARYTFDTYVVGSSNEFAHATAQAVAKSPGSKYNPLFMYGGVGLGKTHLMQAIGNEIYRHDPTKTISYISIESFTNEFIDAIQKKKNSAFTDKYRNVDVLIIDDMQFLAGKEKTQEEFFHTFNALHQANKQIIISSDKPPKQLTSLEERLISRFEMGITVDVQPPDLETRSAILQTKAQGQGVILPLEVIDYLARFAQSNIRELEGALTKVIAHYEMKGGNLDLPAVQRLLAGEASTRSRFKPLSPKVVIDKVAHYFDISAADITGPKRDKDIVVPRQITMYLMRHELNLSFPKIAANVGGRDHTTAMHSVTKMERAIETDEGLRSDIQAVRELLTA